MLNKEINNWLLAFRPKTLPAAIAPVVMGTALALGDGIHHFGMAFFCFLAAISIQIGTNLANDYFDFKKGTDREDRIGPKRVTQSGLIKPEVVKLAWIIAFVFAVLCSIPLMMRGGWPIVFIMIVSVLSGILYTAGPKPLAYVGLGDIFVLVFFGPVAVGGTYYVQSLEINPAVILSGFGPGFISMAILTINNLRDINTDKISNKKTLAVRFGVTFSLYEYLGSLIVAAGIPIIVFGITQDHAWIMYASIILPLSLPTTVKVFTQYKDGPAMNASLAATGKLLIIYAVIYSFGWVL